MTFKDWTHKLNELTEHARELLKDFQQTIEKEDLENMFHIHEMEDLLKDLQNQLDEMLKKARNRFGAEAEKWEEEKENCEQRFDELKAKVELIRTMIEEKMEHESFKKAFESISKLRQSPVLEDIRKMANQLEGEMEGLRNSLKSKLDDFFKK